MVWEGKIICFSKSYLKWHELYIKNVCVYEGVEKTFVRFYDFLFILHVQNSVFLFVTSGQRCAIRGKEAGVHSSHP